MKKYSIGETAKMMGVSVNTLRYWTNEGLIEPEVVDPDSGYRYYSFNQLHYIHRVKYLRDMDVPIAAIREAIGRDNVAGLIESMKMQKTKLENERKELERSISEIDWYIDYFEYSRSARSKIPYPCLRSFGERYAIGTDFGRDDSAESTEIRVDRICSGSSGEQLSVHRQWGYVYAYPEFCRGQLRPLSHYMFLREMPEAPMDSSFKETASHILTFPAGEYLCYTTPLNPPEEDLREIGKLFSGFAEDSLIIANEYEDSFRYTKDSKYEIQLYCGKT